MLVESTRTYKEQTAGHANVQLGPLKFLEISHLLLITIE